MLILIRLTFDGFRLPIFQIRIPITDDRSMSLAEDQESVHWSACALIVANANAIAWIIIRSRDHWRCFHVVVHVFLFHGEIHFAIHFYWFFFPKAKLVYFIEEILSWIYCGLDFFRPEHVFEVFRMCHTVREILPPTFNFVSRLFPFYFLTVFFFSVGLLLCFLLWSYAPLYQFSHKHSTQFFGGIVGDNGHTRWIFTKSSIARHTFCQASAI